jgi:hypothetical protein
MLQKTLKYGDLPDKMLFTIFEWDMTFLNAALL